MKSVNYGIQWKRLNWYLSYNTHDKDTGDVYNTVFEKYESVLDTLLNVSKIHGGLQGLDSLLNCGEIVGSTASLSEMVRF